MMALLRRADSWIRWRVAKIESWMGGWDFNFQMRYRDRRNPDIEYKNYRAGVNW